MKTTTRMMNNRRNGRNSRLSLEQLSSLYKETKHDSIIAEAFERVSKIIVSLNQYYPQVETCDSISIALEKLEMCLRTYNPNGKIKFSTYFYEVFKNKLKQEVKGLNYPKRCIIYKSTSLNYLMEDGFDVSIDSDLNYQSIYLPNNLTDKEILYCKLLALDYGTNKEIAEYMQVSVMTLCNLRKSLRLKLECLYK